MAEPVILADNLTKIFGDFTAVEGLSLSVGAGEVFGFLGPNGCGKSTTIRMLCGLLQPTSGRARIAGWEVATDAERIRERVGYVAQFFNLYGDLTVLENLRFYGGVYGVPADRLSAEVDQWVERLELTDYRRSRAGELSTGTQRALGLAAAVLHEPAVLLLDEPTSGVDPLARRAFFKVIGELAEQGTSVLVTTHVMDEAERCGRLALMNRGRIVAVGSPAEIKGLASRELYRVTAVAPARALAAAEAEPAVDGAALFGGELQFGLSEGGRAGAEAVAARLIGQGLCRGELRPVRTTIEHAFLELLRRDETARDTDGGQ